jgi:hypothetical protein
MRFAVFLFLFSLCSSLAQANYSVVYKCFGSSPGFPTAHIELLADENGKLASSYSLGGYRPYFPTWTNAGEVTTPPAHLGQLLNRLNAYRDTGIDPNQVKLFQNIFIDGNNRFEVNLWKLMDAEGKLIGWVGYAYREMIGCY